MQLQSSLHPQFSTFQEFFYWFCTNTKLWKLVRFRENQISVDFQHFHQFYIPLDKKDTAGGSEKVQYLLHLLMKMFGGLVADCVASIIGLHPSISTPSASPLHPASEPRHAWSLEPVAAPASHHQQSSIRCRGGDCIHSAMPIIWYYYNHSMQRTTIRIRLTITIQPANSRKTAISNFHSTCAAPEYIVYIFSCG